ncbi:formylglycine-generating enzyme family protein [Denitromonas iodatirespirans]|uniref:SUMF1/EgtB/PvdO family nonheme iron enzyme n=1 Tax=Denitromonas iodatirespirans TaxID=2795389 RepID=A0A944DFL2_DENI1|nr:SUMF1/EgtB/PvdO family nonheme iron enzyme [Denitromonas iodatirespirans]MBT0964191.1 SUMF1/EgtB/PvdO family nonheme iron enzyme [Denitromonas iodatirespirans]
MPRTESPSLTKVKPPRQPTISHHFISEDDLEKLPVRKQPPELLAALEGLSEGSIEERVAKLRKKVVEDLVYVRGGSFMRGDFARLMGVDGVTRMTYNEDDKEVREITLSDFWISRYKTTYAEFDVFTDATGRKRTGMEYEGSGRNPFIPAGTYWQDAKDYCQWLGKLTGYPFDLPTEAQWEYAARSRGQFFMIATDDGTIAYGRNIPYAAQAKKLSPTSGFMSPYPVGMFPANPLGLHDMSYNGKEWVNDWYSEDAYANADKRDPEGPESGTEKVIRSWNYGDSLKIGVNVWRRKGLPVPMRESIPDENGNTTMVPSAAAFSPSVRCVINNH